MPKLEIYKGNHHWKQLIFADLDVLGIGRARSSEIVLSDNTRTVSRYHAAIIRVAGSLDQYFVRDFGSLHGTRVCGNPVYQHLLSDGDVIQIGAFRLVYSPRTEAQSEKRRLRIVSQRSLDAFPETSTVGFDPSETTGAAPFSAEQREFLQHLHHTAGRGAESAPSAEQSLAAVLRLLRADQGFIGLFREGHPDQYHETAVVNLRSDESIEISDGEFVEHLKQGNTISDGGTLLVPIRSPEEVVGFLCVSRRDHRRLFSTADADFVAGVGRLIPDCSESHRRAESTATEPLAWPNEIIGTSPKMTELAEEIRAAASTEMNVLVLGETGTGKELVARAIHRQGPHADGPFIARNCGQTTETLAEAEIFGYAPKSGIAGADPLGAKGWFEEAHNGTLFLDEVHRLTPVMQDKFLRVLQDKAIARIGRSGSVPVNVKVLAATDEDVAAAVEGGAMRRPFYHRFGVQIRLPPLRERREDIPFLLYYFLDLYAGKSGSQTRAVSHRALRKLMDFDWPGNVRQLEQTIQAAVATNQEIIFSWDIKEHPTPVAARLPSGATDNQIRLQSDTQPETANPGPKTMDEVEKEKIKEALEVTQGNVTRAAQLLGYKSRQTILNKMDRFGIPRNYADVQTVL